VILENPEIATSVINARNWREWYQLTDGLTAAAAADTQWKASCTAVVKKGNYVKV